MSNPGGDVSSSISGTNVDESKVQELVAKKFDAIEEINRKKSEVAKIQAELVRLGALDRIAGPVAW